MYDDHFGCRQTKTKVEDLQSRLKVAETDIQALYAWIESFRKVAAKHLRKQMEEYSK